jgi:catechol 2,3-dioxygenase-like lactoylglutathione lyase family enzyme
VCSPVSDATLMQSNDDPDDPKGDTVGHVRLGAVAVDCADPAELSDFYKDVLDLKVMFSSPDFVALQGAGVLLTFQRVGDHQRPSWPVGPVPKQLHFELAVSDLDAEESRILALGATKADVQPQPDKWRVLMDPAGHPFCISSLIPAPA